MALEIVVAVALNSVIGQGNNLPWKIPSDLKRFKELTMGHTVVMGRKTWESLPKKPLPGRSNVILSSSLKSASGGEVVRTWEQVVELAQQEVVFVIGGQTLYELALPIAEKIHLTRVHANPYGNVHFDFDQTKWKVVKQTETIRNNRDEYGYHLTEMVRI